MWPTDSGMCVRLGKCECGTPNVDPCCRPRSDTRYEFAIREDWSDDVSGTNKRSGPAFEHGSGDLKAHG